MARQFKFNPFIEIFLVLGYGLLFAIPFLIGSLGKEFLYASDFHAMVPVYDFNAAYIRQHLSIPSWNPYVGTGIPVIGDPVSAVLNPFLTIPLVVWGTDTGLRIVIMGIILASGISMWFLLRRLGVSGSGRIWGAMMYETSGVIAARIVSGQAEQFFAFPVYPVFIASVLPRRMTYRDIASAVMMMGLLLYSGAIYHLFYALVIFISVRLYFLIADPPNRPWSVRSAVIMIIGFFLLGSVKLIDFAVRVAPIMIRNIPAYDLGSIHAVYTVIPFVIPWQVSLYQQDPYRSFFGFRYFWFEYYAHISIYPFFFLTGAARVLKSQAGRILAILTAVGISYISMKYMYSPFFYLYRLIPALGIFRVPMRMYIPMSVIVIAFLSLCLADLLGRSKTFPVRAVIIALALMALVRTYTVSAGTVKGAFEPVITDYPDAVSILRKRDPSDYYAGLMMCCMQRYLLSAKIPVINYYYAWIPRGSGMYATDNGSGFVASELERTRPKYVITLDQEIDLESHRYKRLFRQGSVVVWKTDFVIMSPKL